MSGGEDLMSGCPSMENVYCQIVISWVLSRRVQVKVIRHYRVSRSASSNFKRVHSKQEQAVCYSRNSEP
jgi:hypothetical protein